MTKKRILVCLRVPPVEYHYTRLTPPSGKRRAVRCSAYEPLALIKDAVALARFSCTDTNPDLISKSVVQFSRRVLWAARE
jgi:hypothetical protein